MSERANFAASESKAPTIALRARDGTCGTASAVASAALWVADFTEWSPDVTASAPARAA